MLTSIWFLLLVLPGFVARKIYKQTNNIREECSQFDETLYCLLNSLAIFGFVVSSLIVISFAIPGSEYPLSIMGIGEKLDNVLFVLEYMLSAGALSLLVGLSTGKVLKLYNEKFVNAFRARKGLSPSSISVTVFDDTFASKISSSQTGSKRRLSFRYTKTTNT